MPTAEPTPGMLVTPKLRLVRQLGSGGMGAVWLADHLALNTHVVVKFLADALTWSSEAVGRFAREAAAASQVKSPHVVQMLDHGVTESGVPYIVMELLEGHDLSNHLTSAGLPPREVVPIITQLSRALARAHERGIVHRDIKPSNVFLCEVGDGELFVKLLDFGVAKHDAGTKPGEETRTGALIGSPFYMSPEQLMGEKGIDYRSDLWSLGVLAFEALTGQRPFGGESIGALTMQVHTAPIPLPSQKNPALPKAVDAWFAKACARDPAARFSGAKELATELARALGEEPERGISLDASGPSGDAIGLADTAEASSGNRVRSRSGSDAGSAPPHMSATGAGLTTTGGGKRDRAWRPMALVAVAALAIGGIGSRLFGGAASTQAPPGAALSASAGAQIVPSASTVVTATPLAASTPPALPDSGPYAALVSPPPASPVSKLPSSGSAKHRPGAPAVVPSAAPAPIVSAAPPSPAASATRPAGSEDDIR